MKTVLTLALLLSTGCMSTTSLFDSDCVNYDVFGPYDHSCPEDKHGPCPFCDDQQQQHIKLADL